MKRRSLSENAANLTLPFDPSYKQISRPGVCQINSVILNLTARTYYCKVQIVEKYWTLPVCLICRKHAKSLKRNSKTECKAFTPTDSVLEGYLSLSQ